MVRGRPSPRPSSFWTSAGEGSRHSSSLSGLLSDSSFLPTHTTFSSEKSLPDLSSRLGVPMGPQSWQAAQGSVQGWVFQRRRKWKVSCSQLPGWKLQSQSPSEGLSYATSSSGWTGQGVVYETWRPQPEGASSFFGKLLARHVEQFHVLPCELNITINYSSLNNLVLSTAGSYRGPRLGSTRWILRRNTQNVASEQ